MKTVETDKFNELMKSSVKIRECPHCGHIAEIRVVIPLYGKTGARVQCPKCNCQTEYVDISEMILEKGTSRFGTPITPEALLNGILEAVRLWNGEGADDDTDRVLS